MLPVPACRAALRRALPLVAPCVLALAGPAAANTTVDGDRDANAPLVIEPSTDPVTTDHIDLSGAGPRTVAFIRRMPVTKVVNRITLGDVASASDCVAPARAKVLVREHLTGDVRNYTQLAIAPTFEDLPAVPGKVSWSVQPITLRKGRGYSFSLYHSPSGCRYGRWTTWAHNDAVAEGGSHRCTFGPPAGLNGQPIQMRMWHVGGVDDRDPDCTSSISFDASMPSGWLMTSSFPLGVVRGTNWKAPPTDVRLCGADAVAAGARVAWWRPSPPPNTYSDYVCVWTQYTSLDTTTDHGWYYGIPWATDGSGASRDTYLKLETIDYDTLLAQHQPILKYDSGENFHVLSPAALTDFYVEGGLLDLSNSLKDGQGQFAISNPAFWDSPAWLLDHLSLDYLQPTYPTGELPPSPRSGTAADAGDVISARGNDDDGHYEDDAREMELTSGYPYKVYGRVAHGSDGKLWLQYWFFYYLNPDPFGVFGNVHEGDWEMIQVGLKSDLTPDQAAYAHHNSGETCAWSSVERAGANPVVYVAQHSHASYFGPNRIPSPYDLYDRADGLGGGLFLADLEQIRSEDPAWVAWPGKWGDSGSSPSGPAFQNPKWSDPSVWAGGLAAC